MSAGIDAIGLISGALGIVSFFEDLFPSSSSEGAAVQIKAGLGDDSSNLGGIIGRVDAFDINNNYIGWSEGGEVGAGGVLSLTIDQDTPGVEAAYLSVTNSDIGTCISWISVSNYDGIVDSNGAWNGDIGYYCDQTWYYGNQIAGKLPNNDDWKPYCSWLDLNHDNDTPSGALKFSFSAYGRDVQSTYDDDDTCGGTIFQYDATPIAGAPDTRKRSLPKAPRSHNVTESRRPRREWMKDVLIRSNASDHTAKHICEHPRSWGPDFIGSDDYYCDMETRELIPLCSTHRSTGCLEHNDKELKMRSKAQPTTPTKHKTYKKHIAWKF